MNLEQYIKAYGKDKVSGVDRKELYDALNSYKYIPRNPIYPGWDMGLGDIGSTIKIKLPEGEIKMEEPKNIAIKVLVSKLELEKSNSTSVETHIRYHKEQLKTYNSRKALADKNIKELSAALKKLGHKEETK